MNSRTLTLATLRMKRSCPAQLELFRELFGDSVEVTEALAAEHAGKFNVGWAAKHLLSPQALAAYNVAEAQALATYYEATAQAWAAYEAAKAPALATYEAATAQAWAAYNVAEAQAWARAYISDGGEK